MSTLHNTNKKAIKISKKSLAIEINEIHETIIEEISNDIKKKKSTSYSLAYANFARFIKSGAMYKKIISIKIDNRFFNDCKNIEDIAIMYACEYATTSEEIEECIYELENNYEGNNIDTEKEIYLLQIKSDGVDNFIRRIKDDPLFFMYMERRIIQGENLF